jgi:hypothetical protein
MIEIKSSQIHSIGYADGKLAIRFRGGPDGVGPLYHYSGATQELFDSMRAAKSVGSFFYSNIKGKPEYPCERIKEDHQ